MWLAYVALGVILVPLVVYVGVDWYLSEKQRKACGVAYVCLICAVTALAWVLAISQLVT